MALVAAMAGCNGTDSGGGGTSPPPGPEPAPPTAPDPGSGASGPTLESLTAELALKPDPIPLHDVMETLDELWYEDGWTAMDDGRFLDAAKHFIRTAHLLSVATPEAEHAKDERFVRWMGEAAAAVREAAGVALGKDGDALHQAIESIDEKRCVACHKVYKKED